MPSLAQCVKELIGGVCLGCQPLQGSVAPRMAPRLASMLTFRVRLTRSRKLKRVRYAGCALGRYSPGNEPSANAAPTKAPQMTAHRAIDSVTTKIRAACCLNRDGNALLQAPNGLWLSCSPEPVPSPIPYLILALNGSSTDLLNSKKVVSYNACYSIPRRATKIEIRTAQDSAERPTMTATD